MERLVTLGKRGDLHARRRAATFLFDQSANAKIFKELGPRFKERQGGYTRIMKKGPRFGDGAEQAIIEFVDYSVSSENKTK